VQLELVAALERSVALDGRFVDSTVGILQGDSDVHPSLIGTHR
jgi:hypothetical protein